MVENVLQKLCDKFDAGHARYRVLHHPAGDRSSESVAKVRGTAIGQGAKALVCMAKGNVQFLINCSMVFPTFSLGCKNNEKR